MAQTLNVTILQKMMTAALAALETQRAYLNELDAATGDGDHGTAIIAAMTAASAAVNSAESMTLSQTLEKIGWDVMSAASGSTSTLTGAFYVGMSQAAPSDELDGDAIIASFISGLENVQRSSKAKVGDKTLMDALIPAMDAMKNLPAENLQGSGATLAALLDAAAAAAETGAASTKELIAQHGRARNLGERSRGHLDAGATSTAIIYRAFANAAQ